ncbi:DUF5025 domain-containing protein [Riemerella columbina]|uniref:DUF5025 domain-containing protein n=1 Tax=Riemerella columbina TaxID=103810 RepID=UPI00036F7BC2|nr:DUF5025 domain-containing protein [Riemerella columbina]
MKTILKFSVLSVSLLLTTCKDRTMEEAQEKLPPITQNGANTAGCVINGYILVPKDGINSISGHKVRGLGGYIGANFYTPILGDDYLSLKISNLKDKGKSYWIYLYMNNLKNGVGEYTIGRGYAEIAPIGDHPYIFVRETNNNISGAIYLSGDNSGRVTITKLTKNVCSGTFSGIVYNEDNPTEKIQITDGRFDINITMQPK